MFNPSRTEAREMFFGAWRKYREGVPLAGMEAAALDVILLHPEYHAVLGAPERDRDYTDEANPFLHMSLHLALARHLAAVLFQEDLRKRDQVLRLGAEQADRLNVFFEA